MTDRPILFSAPMVRALLDGRKTQTRRVFKLPTKGIYERNDMGGWEPTINGGGGSFRIARDGSRVPAPESVGIWHRTTGRCLDAPYQVGDRLWVREAFKAVHSADPSRGARYRADVNRDQTIWKPGIHMPRWASRLTLIVTDVRVQRLQEISEEDAVAEGCIPDDSSQNPNCIGPARSIFRNLWDSRNASRGYGWDANPWVVALTFRVIKQNIDQIAEAA